MTLRNVRNQFCLTWGASLASSKRPSAWRGSHIVHSVGGAFNNVTGRFACDGRCLAHFRVHVKKGAETNVLQYLAAVFDPSF